MELKWYLYLSLRSIKYLLGVPSHGFDRPNVVHDENASEKMTRDIENSQDNALSLCTEKVLLARQAYDLVLLPSLFFFKLLCSLKNHGYKTFN